MFKYMFIPKSDPEDEITNEDSGEASQSRLKRHRRRGILLIALLALSCLGGGFLTGYKLRQATVQDVQSLHEKFQTLGNSVDAPLGFLRPLNSDALTTVSCKNPSIRREWRSLSRVEKQDYINAVTCLGTISSELQAVGTLYDDFPWVHQQVSHMTHQSSQFFSWHRQFIRTYERVLQSRCHYNGSLPYWDWTLDWEDLRSAPIWSSDLGFGGDGDPNGEETVGHGRCVTDGPFADVKALIYASHDRAHCLSRGFSNFSGWDARPEAIEGLLNMNEYEKLFLAVENGPHNVVPLTVRGDFYSFTAPYDPVFFLHHAQLDRLWWMWQQRGLPRRLTEYHGPASANSTVGATIQDLLKFRGLTEDIPVSDIMDTEGDHLCYRY